MRSVQPRRRAVGVAVVSLCLVQFVDVLGVTVVVTSLPAMLASLHAAQSYASLIATGYAMFFGDLLMLGARLGDRFGHRRTILVSLLVFAAGAVLGATASSALVLMAGRCLQGAAAAGSVPSALRLLTTMTPDGPIRQRAIALWSAAGAAAGASGFVVGGIVTDLTSWRVVFWAFLPLAATLTAAIMWSVPGDRDADPATSLNLAGAATFTAAIMALVVSTTLITEPGRRVGGALLLASCAVLAGGFLLIDRRATAPLLPARLLGSARLRQGAGGGLLNTATTSSAITLVTLYLQNTLRRGSASGIINTTAQLLRLPNEPGVIAEGFRLLPRLVEPLLTVPSQAVWLLPTPGFRRAAFGRRGSLREIARKTSDPDKALDNLLEHDRMFTERLDEETRRLGLRVINVDTAMTEDFLTERVAESFGL